MKKALLSILAVLAISGTALAGGTYKLDVKTPSAKANEKATVKVHVEGTGGFHVNPDFPTKLTINAPAGVTLEKGTQTKADALKLAKDGADFAVNFTATEKGKKSFTGTFKFATCTDNECKPATEQLAFDVDVK
jgi:hypothetical protein